MSESQTESLRKTGRGDRLYRPFPPSHLVRLPYSVTFPSATTATYRPSWINCITFFPDLAIVAHRDLVLGFCSMPIIEFPSTAKMTCRSILALLRVTG